MAYIHNNVPTTFSFVFLNFNFIQHMNMFLRLTRQHGNIYNIQRECILRVQCTWHATKA